MAGRSVQCALVVTLFVVAGALQAACRAAEDQGTVPVADHAQRTHRPDPGLPPGTRAVWVYIVASEAEAADLKTAIASVPGAPSFVMVASSAAEAQAISDFELGLNSAREAAGEPPVVVRMAGSLASGE